MTERRIILRECFWASLGILLLLGALKHLAWAAPAISEYAFTAAAAAQLYIPIAFIGRRRIDHDSLGLSLAHWPRDLAIVAVWATVTILPFAVGHHFWQTVVLAREFHLRVPEGIAKNALLQLAAVALPEELYFRGYLQERMARLWPARRRLFGAPFGAAIIVTAAIFALAHFVGEYRFDRLGPFFPALVFGLLRAQTGRIVAPVAYHAFCNVLSDMLYASYRSSS